MPTWLTVVLALGGSALISSFVVFFSNRAWSKMVAKKDREETEQRKIEENNERTLALARQRQAQEELSTEIKLILQPLEEKIDTIDKKMTASSEGTLACLRNDILTAYYKCHEKGYRNDYDFQNVHDLYEAYVQLHGNSFIEDVMKRFDQLPSKESYDAAKKKKAAAKSKKPKTSSTVSTTRLVTPVVVAAAAHKQSTKEEDKE